MAAAPSSPPSAWLSFVAAVTDAKVDASVRAFKGLTPYQPMKFTYSSYRLADWASLSEIDRSFVKGPSADESLHNNIAVHALPFVLIPPHSSHHAIRRFYFHLSDPVLLLLLTLLATLLLF